MNPLRVYVDTSVVGGVEDPEFSLASTALVSAFEERRAVAIVSPTLVAEVDAAPEAIRRVMDRIVDSGAELVEPTEEVRRLHEAYLRAAVVGRRYADDAMHVAHATVARADVVASWNFRHMVNPARTRAFNGANMGMGYGMVVILTPADVVEILRVRL